MNEISEVKGSAIIMISIGDPEKEDGHNSTTAMVGKRGDLIEMVAHVAAHPEAMSCLFKGTLPPRRCRENASSVP